MTTINREEVKFIIHGYLTGARKHVTLGQCIAVISPLNFRHDEIQCMIEELLIHLPGEFQDSIYYPPFYWSDRLEAVNVQLNTTGYLSNAAFSEFQLSIDKVKKSCPDVLVVSSSFSCFLVSRLTSNTLKAALRELHDEGETEGEQWWLYVPSVCPAAMSDEDVAALLSFCQLELVEDDGKVDLVIAGIFAIHSHPVERLRNSLLKEMGKMQKALQSVLKFDTDPKKLVSQHMTKKHVIELMRKYIKPSMDVVDRDDEYLFLSALYDHLHTIIDQSFVAMIEHMMLQKGRSLILSPNQANRLQREGERDVIFTRHWSLLHLSMKALQFIKFDQKELLCIKHRCVTIASLLTSFVCWEQNIEIPTSLLSYFSTLRHPDGTLELDFDSRTNLPPLLGLNLFDDADDFVQLTKDDLKRMLKELPKEAAIGVIEMWEMLDDPSTSCSNFCQYLESRTNSTFRVITTRPDKKYEKQVVTGIKTDLLKILSVNDVIPLSLASLPEVAMYGPPSLEFVNYLVLFAFIEITAGSKGIFIPRPLFSIPVLTALVCWLESLVNEESATKHPIERDIKLRAISSLQSLLAHVHQLIT